MQNGMMPYKGFHLLSSQMSSEGWIVYIQQEKEIPGGKVLSMIGHTKACSSREEAVGYAKAMIDFKKHTKMVWN